MRSWPDGITTNLEWNEKYTNWMQNVNILISKWYLDNLNEYPMCIVIIHSIDVCAPSTTRSRTLTWMQIQMFAPHFSYVGLLRFGRALALFAQFGAAVA